MTIQDVVVKTAILFVILVPMAVVGWNAATRHPLLVWGAMLVGLGLGLANAFKRNVSPPLVMLYALVEGVFLGGISRWYDERAAPSPPRSTTPARWSMATTSSARPCSARSWPSA